MKNLITRFLFFVIIVLVHISCVNRVRINKAVFSSSSEIIDTEMIYQQETMHQLQEGDNKAINFLGVELQGRYENLLDRLYELQALSLIERRDTIMRQGNGEKWFSHTVEFCGVPWGMSASFTVNEDDIISIHDMKFITSHTDNEIIDRVVLELTKYYGDPDISDDNEDSYYWYDANNLCIQARHLHAPNGGWTFFFYIAD